MQQSGLDAWRQWNQPNEGWTNFMYTDDAPPSDAFPNGIVTVGMGNALESIGAAQAAGFVNPDGSPADPGTVAAQWQTVHDGPHNSSTGAGYMTTIRLPDAAIMALVDQTVAANEVVLREFFPGWDSFPADGQIAISSKAYAMGTGEFPTKFTNFVSLVNSGQWTAAIPEGHYQGVGTQNRQAQEDAALANAAIVASGTGDPATLYWPGTVTAGAGVLGKVKSWLGKIAWPVAGAVGGGLLMGPVGAVIGATSIAGGRWLWSKHEAKLSAASTPPDPKAVQAALNAAGASPQLTVDGNLGPLSQSAITAFQISQGIPATGQVDSATRAALGV